MVNNLDPPHSPEIDAVLIRQLADVGASTGLSASSGAARGAAWAAKRLKTETASDTARFDPTSAERLVSALDDELHDSSREGPDQSGTLLVRGMTGSGFAGMNPAYVLATVDATNGILGLAAYGKEGLIKQRTAAKAVAKILETLRALELVRGA